MLCSRLSPHKELLWNNGHITVNNKRLEKFIFKLYMIFTLVTNHFLGLLKWMKCALVVEMSQRQCCICCVFAHSHLYFGGTWKFISNKTKQKVTIRPKDIISKFEYNDKSICSTINLMILNSTSTRVNFPSPSQNVMSSQISLFFISIP